MSSCNRDGGDVGCETEVEGKNLNYVVQPVSIKNSHVFCIVSVDCDHF